MSYLQSITQKRLRISLKLTFNSINPNTIINIKLSVESNSNKKINASIIKSSISNSKPNMLIFSLSNEKNLFLLLDEDSVDFSSEFEKLEFGILLG